MSRKCQFLFLVLDNVYSKTLLPIINIHTLADCELLININRVEKNLYVKFYDLYILILNHDVCKSNVTIFSRNIMGNMLSYLFYDFIITIVGMCNTLDKNNTL